jgi:hypothetical protein
MTRYVAPDMVPVVSSNLRALGLKLEERQVWADFGTADYYVYSVAADTEAVFRACLCADSVGTYFARAIKVHPFVRVPKRECQL